MDCVFCKIILGEIPSYKLYEDEDIYVFLDINPVQPGHTLIIPKNHTSDINSIDNSVLIKILDRARDISTLLVDKLGAEGFTLVQNNGIAQEVKHFHLHVIPKYKRNKKMNIDDVYKNLIM